MKLTKKILNELGWEKHVEEGLYYKISNPSEYIYIETIKDMTLKSFVDLIVQDEANKSITQLQEVIQKVLGSKVLGSGDTLNRDNLKRIHEQF